MEESVKNLRFTRKKFLAQLRENLKNSDSKEITWFNLLPYKKENPLIADTVDSLLNKAEKFWKVVTILEKRYSKDIKEFKEHPTVNWFVLKVDREEFTKLCHKYGIKGPDEEDKDDDDEFASLSGSVKKIDKDTNKLVTKIEISKDRSGMYMKINGKFMYRPKRKVFRDRIYQLAESDKKELYIDSDLAKGMKAWFNSNPDNPIYKDGKFKKMTMLVYASDYLRFSPSIDIKFKRQNFAS